MEQIYVNRFQNVNYNMSVDNGGLNITTVNKNFISSQWQPSNFYIFSFRLSEKITLKVGLNLIVYVVFFCSFVREVSIQTIHWQIIMSIVYKID